MRPLDDRVYSLDPPGLLTSRCTECGAGFFPRRRICAICFCDSMKDAVSTGPGIIYTFTIVRSKGPGYEGPVPYALGIVELDEGFRVEVNLDARDLDQLAIGDLVRPFAMALIEAGREEIAVVAYGPEEPDA